MIINKLRPPLNIYDAERASGRTTAVALAAIARAMQSPGTAVLIRDHHDSFHSHRAARDLVQNLIFVLGLQFLNVTADTVTYSIFEERTQ